MTGILLQEELSYDNGLMENAEPSQSYTLPSRSKSPPLKPKLVNKYARPTAQKENAQLPTKNIRNVGYNIQFNTCLSNEIQYMPERYLFQNPTLRIFKPLGAKHEK